MSLEQTSFVKCGDNTSGIHSKQCYVMFAEKQSGLAKINRALRPYHSPTIIKGKYESAFEAGFTESFVGEPHLICECLERLQYLRFQTVCDIKFEFMTNPNDQRN